MYRPLEELYNFEKWSINLLIVVVILFIMGVSLNEMGIENPLSQALFEFFLDPITNESTGDSGYNVVNTLTYGLVLGLFVIVISAWLRHLGIDPSDISVIALLPFVTWAAFGEVAEDARMFGPDLASLFVSPGIHFQAAFWVITAGALGLSVQKQASEESEIDHTIEAITSTIILSQFIIYGSSIHSEVGEDIALWPMLVGTTLAVMMTRLTRSSTSSFSPVQRSVYLVGLGGSLIFLGALVSFALENPPPVENIWPLFVVIGAPACLAYIMSNFGREAYDELKDQGLIAGVLPPLVTEEEYLANPSELIEGLRMKASMAQPLIFLAVSGQLLDGIATWVGIDFFNYSEKHVFSAAIIELFDTALTFAFVKLGLGLIIWYFFAKANFEFRQQHLRLFIGVAFLVVGMAPGLRDVGRLTLGV